jgi:hypothetical protein
MPKRSLMLGGGGLKIAFQAGGEQVWLDEAKLEFDHGDGLSAACFNLASKREATFNVYDFTNHERARTITVRELKAEVPLHYLFNFGRRRIAKAVELGVDAARRWSREKGIALEAPR